MSEQVSFLFMFHVPPSDSKPQQSHPPTHFSSPGRRTINWLHYLPRQHSFCFGLHRPSQFRQFTYIFEFEHVCFCLIPNVSHLSIPKCSSRLSRGTMDCFPKGPALRSWRTESNPSLHSFASAHSCLFHFSPQNLQYSVQASLTSYLNWREKTPWHPATLALRL